MLRFAKVSDAPRMLQIRVAAIRELASSHYLATEIEDWCNSRNAETYHVAIEHQAVLVEEVDEGVIAFGHLNQKTAFVEALYVSPSYSRQGIGLKVLRAIEALAVEHGIMTLTLDASLNAVEFYRRAGYVPVKGVEPSSNPKVSSATLRMHHELTTPTAV